MKCRICIEDGIANENDDRTLDEMETHLKEVHHLDKGELEQYGGDFSDDVQAQIDQEKRERTRQRQLDILLILVGFGLGFYVAYVLGFIWS